MRRSAPWCLCGVQTARALAEAHASGRGVIEIVREKKLLTEKQIAELLDPEKLTGLDPKRYR